MAGLPPTVKVHRIWRRSPRDRLARVPSWVCLLHNAALVPIAVSMASSRALRTVVESWTAICGYQSAVMEVAVVFVDMILRTLIGRSVPAGTPVSVTATGIAAWS